MPGLRRTVYNFYWALERWLTPGLMSSQDAYYRNLSALLSESTSDHKPAWLDVGCGHQVFAEWMSKEQDEVIGKAGLICGIDLDWEGLRKHPQIHNKVYGDLGALPFASNSFNVCSANMVAEHLDKPEEVLREMHRVLEPGGTFVFHTPNARSWFVALARIVPEVLKKPLIWLLEARKAEDVFQTHYLLNRGAQIEKTAKAAGFERAEISYVSSSAITAMLGPLVIPELLWIRWLRRPEMASRRSNLVVRLRKGS
jgi:ubiquinone/menaquinone biosynthesis C-methylase UbiE